jgi:hypothetical protein
MTHTTQGFYFAQYWTPWEGFELVLGIGGSRFSLYSREELLFLKVSFSY